MSLPTIDVQQLSAELNSSNPPYLVDVREADELAISKFPEELHIPLGEFAARISEIPQDKPVVIVCRSGGRSGQATAYLLAQGFTNVRNLEGGINKWAAEIDSTLPLY